MENRERRIRTEEILTHAATTVLYVVFRVMTFSADPPGTAATAHISGELYMLVCCLVIFGSLKRAAGTGNGSRAKVRRAAHILSILMLADGYYWLFFKATSGAVPYRVTYWYLLPTLVLVFFYSVLVRRSSDRNRKLEENVNRLMSDEVAQHLRKEEETDGPADGPDSEPEADIRYMAVMFCCLHGSAEVRTDTENDGLIRSLRFFYTQVSEVMVKYQGTVLEFPGNSVLAVFGAADSGAGREETAVRAALEICAEMREFGTVCRETGLPALAAGIGISSGYVHFGNVGDEKRKRFTAIGSQVNMASRIETYTDDGEILVSESVKRALPEEFPSEKIGEFLPKGASGEVSIYRIIQPETQNDG